MSTIQLSHSLLAFYYSEQREVVDLATEKLTKEQQQKILHRQGKVHLRRNSSISSRGEGTSKRKGKTIDPRNWGNIDFDQESLDIDAQIAALKSLKAQRKAEAKCYDFRRTLDQSLTVVQWF